MSDASQHPSTFTQRALKWTVFLAAAALVVYFCLLILRPFLNVIAWSSVLVITFHPVYQRLVRKTGRVSLSAFVCSVMVVVAFMESNHVFRGARAREGAVSLILCPLP
jgi:predicted PurR-regulated permease PerM